MLLRRREASLTEALANHPVGVEVDLPVVCVVAVRAHGQDRSHRREGEDLDVGGRQAAPSRARRYGPFATIRRANEVASYLRRMGDGAQVYPEWGAYEGTVRGERGQSARSDARPCVNGTRAIVPFFTPRARAAPRARPAGA